MNSKTRRNKIKELLLISEAPKKGQFLAEELGVTRQVIVKDIAILRAEGEKIIATPEGYLIPKEKKGTIRKILAFCHTREQIEDELQCIIKFGGTIEDVIVEHPLYGEIRGMLMIKTLFDIQNFMKNFKEYNAEPLSTLTKGIHLHTIETENETDMKNIVNELNEKGYLVSE